MSFKASFEIKNVYLGIFGKHSIQILVGRLLKRITNMTHGEKLKPCQVKSDYNYIITLIQIIIFFLCVILSIKDKILNPMANLNPI